MSIPNLGSLFALFSISQFALDVYCSLISEGITEASVLSTAHGVLLLTCCQRQMELRDSFLACSICFYISCYFAPQPMAGENPQITVLPSDTFTLYPRHGAN